MKVEIIGGPLDGTIFNVANGETRVFVNDCKLTTEQHPSRTDRAAAYWSKSQE